MRRRAPAWGLAAALAIGCSASPRRIPCNDDYDCFAGSVCSSGTCQPGLPPVLAIDPAVVQTLPGATARFAVQGQVTWSVLEQGGGTIDAAGGYTAPLQEGTYTVVAASVAFPGVTATAKVTVALAPVVVAVGSPTLRAIRAGRAVALTVAGRDTAASISWAFDGAAPEAIDGPIATLVAGQVPQVTVSCTATLAGRSATSTLMLPVVLAAERLEVEYPETVPVGDGGVVARVTNPMAGVEYRWCLDDGCNPTPPQIAARGTAFTFPADRFHVAIVDAIHPAAQQGALETANEGAVVNTGTPPAVAPQLAGPSFLLSGVAARARVVAPVSGLAYGWTIAGGSWLDGGAGPASGASVEFRPDPGAAQVLLTCNGSNAPGTPATLAVPVSDHGLMLLAGRPGGAGNVDGAGVAARFDRPFQLAGDGKGGAFVLEKGSATVRHLAGDASVTTIAGAEQPGAADGPGPAARFSGATAIAAAGDASVFVADRRGLRRLVKQPDGSWQVDTVLPGFAARSLAAADAGTLYALVDGATPVVRVSGAGGSWGVQPIAASSGMHRPGCLGLADPDTVLLVDDTVVSSLRSSGTDWTLSTLASGITPADFRASGCQIVQTSASIIDFTHPTDQSAWRCNFVNGGWSCSGWFARRFGTDVNLEFLYPIGLAAAGDHVLLADELAHLIRWIPKPDWHEQVIAGAPAHPEAADGAAIDARLTFPVALARLGSHLEPGGGGPDGGAGGGDPAVDDCQAFEAVSASGVARVLASPGVPAQLRSDLAAAPPCAPLTSIAAIGGGFALTASGPGCAALYALLPGAATPLQPVVQDPVVPFELSTPSAIAVVAEYTNQWVFLVADALAGSVRGRSILGTAAPGLSGQVYNLPVQRTLAAPHAVAGHVIASEQGIWIYGDLPDPLGVQAFQLTRVAGAPDDQPGGYQDGPGASARFRMTPWHGFWPMVAVDASGAIFVADSGNHAIRKVAQDAGGQWQVSTVAGGPDRHGLVLGPGPVLNTPLGLALRCDGRLAIADPEENAVLLLAP